MGAPSTLVLGILTDLHFGPEIRYQGKLRKLSHQAPVLAERAVRALREEVRPHLLVNLGDDIEDESREADRARYTQCQEVLRQGGMPIVNVAGNHDIIHLNKDDLLGVWGEPKRTTLYYSLDCQGHHLVVLHTLEAHDSSRIHVPAPQLEWLAADLAATALPTVILMHHSASEQDVADSRWFSGRPQGALVENRAELREIIERSGRVRVVLNGHLHRNHFDAIRGIPYITFQSLIENVDDDAPGRPAATYSVVRLTDRRIHVRVHGEDPARYQVELT